MEDTSNLTEEELNKVWEKTLKMSKEELVKFLQDDRNREMYLTITEKENSISKMVF